MSLEQGGGKCGWCGQCLNIAWGTMGGQEEEPIATLSSSPPAGLLSPPASPISGTKEEGGATATHFTLWMVPATFAGELDMVPGSAESSVLE